MLAASRTSCCQGISTTGYKELACEGPPNWGFGVLRDRQTPLSAIFSAFACLAVFSVILVLLIKPRKELT
jgi:MFS transporter, Spinster family, sphingosine-1-phosphate transporter